MRISESCAKCLFDKQMNKSGNADFLAEIKSLLDNRTETDTSPYMVYMFNEVYRKYFGKNPDYRDVKKKYNDLVLKMEDGLRHEISSSDDPLAKSLIMARTGNYIDFGAMNHIDSDEFLNLLCDTQMRDDDLNTYRSFLNECEKGKKFLIICDNCGEIVLDKLMLEQLKERFPHLEIKAMVRGGEVLNDASYEDALYVRLDKAAEVISSGVAVGGTIYEMLSSDAKEAIDDADVILSKGQGNYESLSEQGRHIFYEFLCKCELFTNRFNVPKLTGIFIEEK